MLDEFFTFPIVMIDGENEERKMRESTKFGDLPNKAATEEEQEYDMVYGEAEYPYWDFIGVEDRWLPSKESFDKALSGSFEACIVRFVNVGQLLVPWSKRKFKKELVKFADEYEVKFPKGENKKELRIMTLSPDQYKKMTDDTKGEE